MKLQGVARIFPWEGGEGAQVIVFIEKCLVLVDRPGRTSECYIEVEQKRGEELGTPFGYTPEAHSKLVRKAYNFCRG